MVDYKVAPRETIYFFVRLTVTILVVLCLVLLLQNFTSLEMSFIGIFALYGGLILLYLFIRKALMVGFVKNNGVRITNQQFPEIYSVYLEQVSKLGIAAPPDFYILQSGGALNAFATRFIGSDYVVIYSDVLETAYEVGNRAAEFIMAHELGHVKRKHMSKNFWLLPSIIVPFLPQAYSRACELTCDNIGQALCPQGGLKGMLILAAGKRLYRKINTTALIDNYAADQSTWKWFAEIFSSHPPLPKRILNLYDNLFRLNSTDVLPEQIACPICQTSLALEKTERIDKKFFCPTCNKLMDLESR